MIKEKLIKRFGDGINHMSCVYLNDGEVYLREALDKVKPTKAIEIGTYQGVSTAIISEYCKKVWAFDIFNQPLRAEIWNFLKIENIEFDIAKDREAENKTIKKLIKDEKIDFCFIDGAHFHGELEKDFDACKACPNILIHDYTPEFPEVFEFVQKQSHWELTEYPAFALLQKKKRKSSARKSKNNTSRG